MNPIVLLLGLGAVFMLTKKSTAAAASITPNAAEKYCINYFESRGEDGQVFVEMTNSEILDCYTFLHDFIAMGTKPTVDNPLYYRIQAISSKYNVFT